MNSIVGISWWIIVGDGGFCEIVIEGGGRIFESISF
jgi:hypothetical protein